MRVGVLDYGAGNIFSILSGLKRADMPAEVFRDPHSLPSFDGIVIPGVGSFSQITSALDRFREGILDFANSGKVVLGICLGMQVLLDSSKEGSGDGLGLISGVVKRLPPKVKIPHMGWNNVEIWQTNPLVDGLSESPYFYFVHSYYTAPDDSSCIVGTTQYGLEFASIIGEDTLFGVQFHPEKSGKDGAQVLRNFRRLLQR